MSSKKKRKLPPPPSRRKGVRIYTLEVAVMGGPMTDEFLDANPVVARTIVMLGDQTLEALHWAIYDAFGRFDDHMYEFQFGAEPMEPDAARYVMFEDTADEYMDRPATGLAPRTTLDDLDLTTGKVFFYWFDFGDDWWHSIKVAAIDLGTPAGEFPRVVARTGANPPQYPHLDDEDEDDEEFEDDEFDDEGRVIEDVTFVEVDDDDEDEPKEPRA
ncbi:MAG: hypothetical protein BGO49_25410 [Planctomycetales bacterium 71-10]|nr:MAG: hypothetical protein BGO49_25410 [Planctomycetales bacterium 71-10]